VRYLLDTDTLVYWLKGDSDIEAKALAAGLDQLALSIMTKAELYFGAYNSAQRNQNLAAIEKLTQTLTVLSFDDAVADRFGALKAALKQSGNLGCRNHGALRGVVNVISPIRLSNRAAIM